MGKVQRILKEAAECNCQIQHIFKSKDNPKGHKKETCPNLFVYYPIADRQLKNTKQETAKQIFKEIEQGFREAIVLNPEKDIRLIKGYYLKVREKHLQEQTKP